MPRNPHVHIDEDVQLVPFEIINQYATGIVTARELQGSGAAWEVVRYRAATACPNMLTD
jgi:hypothetical protein